MGKLGKARLSKDRYLDLVVEFPLRKLQGASDHRMALRMLRRETANVSDAGVKQYLEVLVSLIASYEKDAGLRLDTTGVTPAEVVRHLLDERGMSVNACAKAVGMQQSDLSNMLSGKRDWSKSAIIKLSGFFKLNPAMFLRAA